MLPIDLSEAGCPADYFKKQCCMHIYRIALKTSHDHVILKLKYVLSKLVIYTWDSKLMGSFFVQKTKKNRR